MHQSFPLLILLALCAPLAAQTFDDFEAYPVGFGQAQMIGANPLDDTTITGTGFGPNLVADGCSYSTNGFDLQWNGNGFFGQLSRNLCGAGTMLLLDYDNPPTNLSFSLQVFNTAPDLVTVELYDSSNVLIQSTTGISVVDGAGVPFSYQGTPVAQVRVIATLQPSSPIIDDHEYGGPNLQIVGGCPGAKTLTVTGATPNGSLAIGYGNAGSFTIPVGSCIGTVLDISNPTLVGFFPADGLGSFSLSFNAPAGLCGKTVQVVDMATCMVSQTAVL